MEWATPPSIVSRSMNSSSRTNINVNMDNLTHYTQILQGNRYNREQINSDNLLLLKKLEFDIFYSTIYKYPLLVAETITAMTGFTDPNHPPIDRRKIEDPFRQDLEIPAKHQYTLEDYKAYMEYGGSLGHNAPAGQHKTNMDVYNETFVLTNITPQEMVLNSGLWVLMEQWCRYLGRNTRLEKVMVFTGSIPAKLNSNFRGVKMNIPSKMFKIICIKMPEHPNICHVEIFLCYNKSYSINYALPKYDLSPYLLPHTQYSQFERESGIDLKKLLEYYNFSTSKIIPFRAHLNISINLNPALRLQMKKSKWFGKLIYAKNLDILEREWIECQKLSTEFQNLEFHQEYYLLTKRRLKRGSQLSRTIPTNYTWDSIYQRHIKSKSKSKSKTKSKTKSKSKSKSKSKRVNTRNRIHIVKITKSRTK